MDRRSFLRRAGAMAMCLPADSFAQRADFWSQPRQIWLRRPATGEEVRTVYFADGRIIPHGYEAACRILRDVHANESVYMSPVLLDILCGLGGWLSAFGVNQPLITNSGFRTRATNAKIEGAARNSKHVEGRAWDGHVPGVSSNSLARFGQYLAGGGVGFYNAKDFVHLDDGALRVWRG